MIGRESNLDAMLQIDEKHAFFLFLKEKNKSQQ
jgi:hypothetical protein